MVKTKTTTRFCCLCLTGAIMAIAMIAPSASSADFEIVPGSVEIQTLDSGSNPDTRAGAHPDRTVVKYELDVSGTALRDLKFEFGPGLTGSPFATPVCPRAIFENEVCPDDTQVGMFNITFGTSSVSPLPIYNVAPTGNQIATLGFVPFWQTELGMFLRSTDFGLSMASSDMAQIPSTKGEVELWGVPADHAGGSERVAFLTTPTECGPLKMVLWVRSWEVGAPWLSETAESLPFTECEDLPFEPHFDLGLSDPIVDSSTGAQIDLEMTAHTGPDEQMSTTLKEVKVDLPDGMTVSPGGAESMEVCQDAQFGLGTESAIECPFRSRVGTVELETPQLGETLIGGVFLGEELPGERFRLFVGASAAGIQFKALGKLVTDSKTGDLSTVLTDLPQVPLSRISLNLDSGPTALLASPLPCGPAQAQAHFVPHGPHEPVDAAAMVNVESRPGATCPGALGFSPGLIAGSSQAKAGKSTDFSFTLVRQDGEELMKKLSLALPEGLNANLTVVDVCGAADADAGTCAAGSRIGSAVAEIGSGERSALVRGNVYLTEAYRGAPFGLSLVFDGRIGPFNLGPLNVRGMLRIDPHTGQHSLEIDPLPVVFEGLALRFLTVAADLDRPGFIVSPTSCEPSEVLSSIHSVDGRPASIVVPFNIDGCNHLGFRPSFSVAVKNHERPSKLKLSFGVQTRKGDANLRQFKVKFPELLAFRSGGARALCTRGDAAEDLCPAASRVGSGVSRSPLLPEPLRGPVYLVQPKGGGFPDFLISLEGGGVPLQLTGKSSRQGGRLVTKMVDLPDIPLTTFSMTLNGGKNGLVSLKGSPCGGGRGLSSPVALEAHDGAYRGMHVQLKASCDSRKRIVGRQAPDRRR